jgi:pimeloyl-ACP methyl ester carboxylesterase
MTSVPRRILFCHGLESGPVGRKSQGLRDLGYEVEAPDARGLDLPARVEMLTARLRRAPVFDLVVGSSFGGIAGLAAVILVAREGVSIPGLVLCAPALQRSLREGLLESLAPPCPTIVVHGRGDDVIPIDLSRSFAQHPGVTLVEVDDDHRLAGPGFDAIAAAVAKLTAP